MASFLLDQVSWDVVVDLFGNIAICTPPYAIAQDVACAARLFEGELWYDTSQGIPYWQNILGQMPPLSYLKAQYTTAAQNVIGVVQAQTFIASIGQNRELTGQIQVTSETGESLVSVGIAPQVIAPATFI